MPNLDKSDIWKDFDEDSKRVFGLSQSADEVFEVKNSEAL